MVALTKDLRTITGGLVKGEGTVGQLAHQSRALRSAERHAGPRERDARALPESRTAPSDACSTIPTLYNRLVGVIGVDRLARHLDQLEQGHGGPAPARHDALSQHGRHHARRRLAHAHAHERAGHGEPLLTDQTLYDQLNKLVTDLSAILADVRRDPRRYTKGMVKVF